ncbi:AAEL003562-PA [Aedes aegypti]|uniref:AAEL003562-PA n=2 Tax=Aedes aegypti TaxID=7159 RepID=A0A1S4F5C3_AEDAE|nr:bromodomain-containing protein 8 [Aedes aegypti]EAT45132.1 AAEL003562-PA [Aedes aegypti]
MASIQERLQLKRVPLDKWSTKEKLCLASAVAYSGDQNWMSVSRSLKMLCGAGRPGDWFSQKSCAAQYGKLLENVETPKRKKRTASERDGVAAVETPGESILRKLTQERMIELKKIIQEEAQQYTKVKEDIILIQRGVTDEQKLREMWKQIQTEKAQKEKEQIMHAQWLKEREEKKLELERQWRPLYPGSPNSSKTPGSAVKIKEEIDEDSQSSSKSGTSPLLTSLLKSPSTNPAGNQVLSTPGNSKSSTSPTITNLLTGNSPVSINVLAKNLFPATEDESKSNLEGNKTIPQEESQSGIPTSNAYQIAPNLTKLLDTKQNDSSSAIVTQEPQESNENTTKQEDMDTDDNVDPAKDLMAVFQELMPEELDEILNENSGMILEDEILDNVVDSIMEEEEDEDGASVKGKDLNALESANLANSISSDDKNPERKGSKNLESAPEVAKGAYLKPAAAAPSPERHNPFEENVDLDKLDNPEYDTRDKSGDDKDSKLGIETEGSQILLNKDSIKEETRTTTSNDQESTNVPEEDSCSSSYPTVPSSDEHNKQSGENASSGQSTNEQIISTIKADTDEDFRDKELVSRDTASFEVDSSSIKTEIKQKEGNSELESDEMKMDTTNVDSKPQLEPKPLSSEEEAARAKKEALEKLAAEYDFKDDEEPIVPLSIQKSKEEKHTPEEDVYMDAQEHLDEVESPKEADQKKQDDAVVTITDTDDDSLIEMKISKTKRDYSRRRTVDDLFKPKEDPLATPKNEESEGRSLRKLRDRERSESPFVSLEDDPNDKMKRSYSSTPVLDSIPNSPASSEDREYRAWKKAILSILAKVSSCRQAAAFLKPLPDEQVSDIIYRPMDLSVIKKNVENGIIRSSSEFQRDVMLMYTNAMVLNRPDLCCSKAANFLVTECIALMESIPETSRNQREKEPEGRASSASKRTSRKGTTRSSSSGVRN